MKLRDRIQEWLYSGWHLVDVFIYACFMLLLLWMLVQNVYAGDNCDSFEAGWRDGYCATQVYACYAPIPPMCADGWFTSQRQAYHAGYSAGENKRGQI